MIHPTKEHQIIMKAELEITSTIDMNTRDLMTRTYLSTTYSTDQRQGKQLPRNTRGPSAD